MKNDFAALLTRESPDAAVIRTRPGELLYRHEGAELIFGNAGGEALSRCLGDLIVPANHDEEERVCLRDTIISRHVSLELLPRRNDGPLTCVDVSRELFDSPEYAGPLIPCTKMDLIPRRILRDVSLIAAYVLEPTPDGINDLPDIARIGADKWKRILRAPDRACTRIASSRRCQAAALPRTANSARAAYPRFSCRQDEQ